MRGDGDRPPPVRESGLPGVVARKAARKLRAQRDGSRGAWFGMGMSGLIGWSVALPTLLGALLGLWLDHHHPGPHSWTLTLMVIGLAVGSLSAWRWLAQQNAAIDKDAEAGDE